MNMQASATDTTILRTKLRGLTFKSADALAKKLKGGPVGFNPFTRFSATNGSPMVHQYAEWMLQNFNHAAIAANVDAYMERSRAARAHIATKRGIPLPAANPVPTNPEPATTEPDANPEPEETPATEADTPEPVYAEGSIESMIAAIVRAAMARQTAGVNPAQVIDIVKPVIDAAIERAKLPRVTHIHVTRTDGTTHDAGRQHKLFPDLLNLIALGFPVWIPGPAGSGKTTAVNNAAKALDAMLYMPPEGPVENKYGFIGYNDAAGNFNATTLYHACKYAAENPEKRVIFFIDECDAGYANALMVLNAVMENGYCTFANGERITFGRNLQFIAGANTYGNGATSQYVGRNKLDDATLDRFIMLAWDYDTELETGISGNPEWSGMVQRIRDALPGLSIKHVISPRASIRGAAMLAAGWDRGRVLDMVVYKGLSADQKRQIAAATGIR